MSAEKYKPTGSELSKAVKSAHAANLQDLALHRLLWCLNAGGRRRYRVVERPDEAERTEPRPDYVCEDALGSAYVTVEVCRFRGLKEEDRNLAVLKQLEIDVNDRLMGRLSGRYDVGIYYPLEAYYDLRGRRWRSLVDSICARVLEAKDRETDLFPYIVKRSDSGQLWVRIMRLLNDEYEVVSEGEILDVLNAILSHAELKLSVYCRGVGIALCENMVRRVPWLPGDAVYFSSQIKWDKWPSVQRCYVVGDSLCSARVHRLL